MSRRISQIVFIIIIILTMAFLGCSRGGNYNHKTLNIIFSVIKGYNKEFSKKGIAYPLGVIVHRKPGPTEKVGSDLYWRGTKTNEFLAISKETWLAYQKGKVRFNGESGDYYYFSFMLLADDEKKKKRGGVLFLPDGSKMNFELEK